MSKIKPPSALGKEIIKHIGKYGVSSEKFLLRRFNITPTILQSLKREGYLKREHLQIMNSSDGYYQLEILSKRILDKGEYFKGSVTRNEYSTLLGVQEVMLRLKQKYDIIGEVTERQLKGLKAREAKVKGGIVQTTEGIKASEGAKERLELLHSEVADHRIAYKPKGDETAPLQFMDIEIHGAYHGKELANKIKAMDRGKHPVLWVVMNSRKTTLHVQKYVDQEGAKNITVIYIEDLK